MGVVMPHKNKAKALVLTAPTHGFFIYTIMSKQVKQATYSHTANRRRRQRKLYQRNSKLIEPLAFAEMHGGSFRMRFSKGTYFVGFESADKKTHAWGSSFANAYRNFLRVFNEKYAV